MEKIKHFIESDKGKDILVVLIVILVGLGSFELGRLSKEGSSEGIKILSAIEASQYSDQIQQNPENDILSENSQNSSQIANISSAVIQNQNRKSFFASNRGSKYYSLGCSAGKNVKQENRIYFETGEEAQKAGYTLSSSCR